jgi:hypothetical protein
MISLNEPKFKIGDVVQASTAAFPVLHGFVTEIIHPDDWGLYKIETANGVLFVWEVNMVKVGN